RNDHAGQRNAATSSNPFHQISLCFGGEVGSLISTWCDERGRFEIEIVGSRCDHIATARRQISKDVIAIAVSVGCCWLRSAERYSYSRDRRVVFGISYAT